MLKMIYKAQTERYRSFSAFPAAIKDFVEHVDVFLERMAWSSDCRSWFKDGQRTGPVTALYPGSRNHWFRLLGNIRREDWQWESLEDNRWAFIGNGFDSGEIEDKDLTWYLDHPEQG